MNKFDDLCSSIISKGLSESVIDIPRNSLDPTVFQFPDTGLPILQPMIKTQIIQDVESINQVVPVHNFYIIGSILSKHYNSQSDIDVNVEIDEMDMLVRGDAFNLIRRINGQLATGSTHPINYYLVEGTEYDIDKTSAAYDVASERWLKEPEEINIELTQYVDKFQNVIDNMDLGIASLRRNIIDIEELLTLDKSKIKQLGSLLKNKLEAVEKDVEVLIRSYQDSKQARIEAFQKDMTPEKIVKYGKKYKLPENVVYKMIEKYHYQAFVQKLKEILSDDEEIKLSDIKDLKSVGQKHWNFSESVLSEKNKPKTRKSKIWKDPLNRHQMKNRGFDRTTGQTQISNVHKVGGRFKGQHKALTISKEVVEHAKKSEFGIWRVSKPVAEEIAFYYDLRMPTQNDRAKILGKTKIILWIKKPNHYYLVKDKLHYHDKKSH